VGFIEAQNDERIVVFGFTGNPGRRLSLYRVRWLPEVQGFDELIAGGSRGEIVMFGVT
jgi:hypothetical protein